LPVAMARSAAPSRSRIPSGALIAASIVICTLGWLSLGHKADRENRLPARSSIAANPDAAGRLTLTRLQLPLACRTFDDLQAGSLPLLDLAANLAERDAGSEFGCCTKCHRSGGTGPATDRALRALDLACAACHRPTDSRKLAGVKLVKLRRGAAEEPVPFRFGDRA
jgi:hypothetical protein